jgi:hypothetical protein
MVFLRPCNSLARLANCIIKPMGVKTWIGARRKDLL